MEREKVLANHYIEDGYEVSVHKPLRSKEEQEQRNNDLVLKLHNIIKGFEKNSLDN